MSTSSHVFDVAVVGAGLGGACAALALAQRGARVAVFESAAFPRHKVCGEFLSPEILHTFARLGVEKTICDAKPFPVQSARVYAPNNSTSSTRCVEIALPHAGWGLSRFQLDAILWREMQSRGVQTFDKTRIKKIARDGDGFQLQSGDKTFSTCFVINAAGRNSRFFSDENAIEYSKLKPRYVGFKTHFANAQNYDGAVELHAYDGGYCGVGAIENGLTNICALARYETVAGRSPDEFWNWQLAQSTSLRARMQGANLCFPWLATANVSFGRRAPIENGVFNCGDSAGYIHPLTGNGMAMAARGGELAAAAIASSLRGAISKTDAAELYARAWNREFASRLEWATRLEKVLIAPRLVNVALTFLRLAPSLAQLAVVKTRG